MIISETRYASAYVTSDGQERRFDDLGEMLAFVGEEAEDVAVYWVHDYETEEWLKADEAFIVKSAGERTPMGYGIVAFADRARAESWAAANQGAVATLDELLAQGAMMNMDH
jgi:copper chaperone NosL